MTSEHWCITFVNSFILAAVKLGFSTVRTFFHSSPAETSEHQGCCYRVSLVELCIVIYQDYYRLKGYSG